MSETLPASAASQHPQVLAAGSVSLTVLPGAPSCARPKAKTENHVNFGVRRSALALAAASAVALVSAPAALAQAPTPCTPVTSDPTGDQSYGLAGNQSGIPAAETVDITGLYFHRAAGGKTTANAVIANLSKTVPAGSAGLVYRFFYTAAGTDYFLEVDVATDGTVSYTYGHIETTLVSDGDSTGQFIEGPNGVVSIEIPATHGGKSGVKFSDAYLLTAYSMGAFISSTDFAPDGDGRIAWNGNECGGTAPAPTPGTTPAPTPPPSSGPAAAPKPAAAQGPLQVSIRPAAIKARKLKKTRKLALNVSSKEQLTNVVFTLKKGKASVGSGKLAQLANAGKVTLKLKKKGLKKGAYALVVTARRADGSTGTVTLKFRVR